MTFFGHARLSLHRAFKDFDLARDMAYGAILAAITLTLQVWWRLIPLKDWQEHWWQWIASFVLPFLIVLSVHVAWRLISAPWRVHQDQEKEFADQKTVLEARNADLQKGLSEEIDKRKRPEVAVICDWKMPEKRPIERDARSFLLQTINDVAALDVKILDIRLEEGIAQFEVVPLITGRSQSKAYCTIDQNQNATYAAFDFFSLVRQSVEKSGKKMSELELPIVVEYRDAYGTWHESINKLKYNWFLGQGRIVETQFRIKRRPALSQ